MTDRPTQEVTLPPEDGDEDPRVVHIDPLTGEVVTPDGRPTGRTLAELAENTNLDLRIAGTSERMDTGDVAPEDLAVLQSVLVIKGGEFHVRGQFRAGDKIVVAMEVSIEMTGFRLVRQRGDVVGVKRIHDTERAGFVRTLEEVVEGTARVVTTE